MQQSSTWMGISLLIALIPTVIVWVYMFRKRGKTVASVLSWYALAGGTALATFLLTLWLSMVLGRTVTTG
jgi:RsiW-degrading membrane proteinase PrsW (M82 family)